MVLGIQTGNYFLEPIWLYALLSLLPLIILYLIRPKPQERTIPSLMFFLRDLGASDKRSFFKRFTRDWLFLLQLLVLLILALSVAKPFIEVPEGELTGHTVIVIDASASMQTMMNGDSRFEEARDIALDNLASVNTIIVAKNIPLVAKERVNKEEAREFLEGLEPSDTSTAIYDSARSAMDYANEDTRIVVISDFLETEVDNDVNTVKKALKAKGAVVSFHPVTSDAGNIGIVDVVVKDETTSVQVRNYYDQAMSVPIRVGNIQETLELDAGSAEVFTFSTPSGVTEVSLDVNDDFELDNKAIISTPKTTNVDVLFITNEENVERSNLWVALNAINQQTNYQVSIEKAVPPRSVRVNHDIVILKDFDQDMVLPGVFNDIEDNIEERGTSLIITPQPGMFGFQPLQSLLPVSYEADKKQGGDIRVVDPEIESLTEDVNFGHVDYYFDTRLKSDARAIAAANGNDTIIAYESRGAGSILYYGIFDQDVTIDGRAKTSTFKNDLFYPIFWKRVLDLLTDTPSVESLNRRTGRVINLAQGQEVETPSGAKVSGVFQLDKQGIYTFRNQDIAANLIHSQESDVSGRFTETEVSEIETQEVERERPKPLTQHFIIAGLLLLLLELIYTKFRGDM